VWCSAQTLLQAHKVQLNEAQKRKYNEINCYSNGFMVCTDYLPPVCVQFTLKSLALSLTPPLYIEVPVPNQESEWSCICVLMV
jgi:hypothetical protein